MPFNTEIKNNARAEGARAKAAGKPRSANPYRVRTDAGYAWVQGWEAQPVVPANPAV